VRQHPCAELLGRPRERTAGGDGAPARERAGAGETADGGVGRRDGHRLRLDAEHLGDDLRERRVRALTDRRGRRPDGYAAVGAQREVRAVVALDPDHAAADEYGRVHPGRLDLAADAAEAAGRAGGAPLFLDAVEAGGGERELERGVIVAAVVALVREADVRKLV